MNNPLSLTVLGNPHVKSRPRFTRSGHAYHPDHDKDDIVISQLLNMVPTINETLPIKESISVSFKFYQQIPKSVSKVKKAKYLDGTIISRQDVSNLIKSIEDNLILAGIIEDDNQILFLSGSKQYDDNPRTEILIENW